MPTVRKLSAYALKNKQNDDEYELFFDYENEEIMFSIRQAQGKSAELVFANEDIKETVVKWLTTGFDELHLDDVTGRAQPRHTAPISTEFLPRIAEHVAGQTLNFRITMTWENE